MQGYQFAHMETWSRKGVAKENGNEKNVRRNGQRGWTAEQNLDEAAREPWASEHLGRPKRAPTVIAGTCASFDELRGAHEEACNAKVAVPYTNPKTRKKGTRKKSVRLDTHTLYTAVLSFPVTSAEALEDAKKMAECRKAIDIAIAFEKRRLVDAGGEFAMGVVHFDETYVHLHVYGLDRQRGSAKIGVAGFCKSPLRPTKPQPYRPEDGQFFVSHPGQIRMSLDIPAPASTSGQMTGGAMRPATRPRASIRRRARSPSTFQRPPAMTARRSIRTLPNPAAGRSAP